jgi:putative ABC transport system permease protein
MTTLDSLSLAWRTVRSNKLRTGITVAIIAFGIMALIGIITAIEAMNQSLKESFSSMGANAFNIRYKESRARMGGNGNDDMKKRGADSKKKNPISVNPSAAKKRNSLKPIIISRDHR